MNEFEVSFILRTEGNPTNRELKDYIITEVEAGGGCRTIDDELFEKKILSNVKVKKVNK